MEIIINGEKYPVEVIRKGNKKTYIRVKEPNIIVVTTSFFVSDKAIKELINNNIDSLSRMIDRLNNKIEKDKNFYYLGKKYDIVNWHSDMVFSNNRLFVDDDFDLDKWYRKEASKLFQIELDKVFQSFCYDIPYPKLVIRKMTTRWGVCNTKEIKVTLNLELIKRDIKCLDYVIVHELSHLIHANHSKDFWKCVEDNFPNYKTVRKELKENE